VPLVFAGPGVPANARTDAFAYLLDIFPTLCDLAGLDVPGTVEGKSLVPAMLDPDEMVRDTLYLAYTQYQRGVRDQRYKLIEYHVNGRRTTQLFDVEEDPWETENLAEDPGMAGEVARLRAELLRLRDAWDDTASEWGKTFWDGWSETGGE
jgi:arylsulfatase A-like enzyme